MSPGKRPWTRAALTLLGLAVLALYAYEPLLRADLVAADHRILAELGPGEAADAGRPEGGGRHLSPLTRASLRLSCVLAGAGGGEPPAGPPARALRLESGLLLLVAAVGLAFFTRRLLLPWTGSEHATAAAWASALLLILHPLCSAAVGGLAGRSELFGLLLAVWSGAAFLRGRQERRIGFTAASFVLCGLGGFASDLILGLPVLLGSAEFLSARRYRSVRGRLRTTLTTLTVFGAAASLDLILHVSRLGADALPPALRTLRDISQEAGAGELLARAVEKVGLLVLPANFAVLGIAGPVLAGIAFLVAMHPALVAARTAPRLWSWFLAGWLAALAVTELLHAHVRVAPAELHLAGVLLPSVAVVSVGLGIGVTALSGMRRTVLPWVVAVAYAVVAHQNARPWYAAGTAASELRADLAAALAVHGRRNPVLVLDPPPAIAGVEPAGEALPWLIPPAAPAGDEPALPPSVRGLGTAAFLAFVREPEFAAHLAGSVLVLVPPAASPADPGAPRRRAVLLGPGGASDGPRSWRDDLGSPAISVNPRQTSVLRVTAPPGTDVASLEEITWTSAGGARRERARAGVWFLDREEPRGIYDLGGLLSWRLADRVRGIHFEGGTRPLSLMELREELPSLGVDPRADPSGGGESWTFGPVTDELVLAHLDRGRFVFGILDLEALRYAEIDVAHDPDGGLHARIPAAGETRAVLSAGHPVAWTLEFRIDGRAVARSRGRLHTP
ncbi:MAG: hypothetical protein AB1726_08695 [Planctomycetota bacterium]